MTSKATGTQREVDGGHAPTATHCRKEPPLHALEAEVAQQARDIARLNEELQRERLENERLKDRATELERWLSVFSEMNMSQDQNRVMLRVNAVS